MLRLISQLAYCGCRLSNFYCPASMTLEQTLLLKSPTRASGSERFFSRLNFLPHLFSLLTLFRDPRLATRVAQLLHRAGCPFLAEPPHHSLSTLSQEALLNSNISINFYNGRKILIELAEKLDVLAAAEPENSVDMEQIGWLLNNANALPSLQSISISTIRQTLETEIPMKLETLRSSFPSRLLDLILHRNLKTC